jgi:VWFA-related protein
MRSLLLVIALSTVTGAQTFRSTVDHVAVPVTIHSEQKEFVADLRPEDFRVFDDGEPVQIVTFGNVRQSVHVLLLLDTSRSMTDSVSGIRSAASAVVGQLAPNDSIRIGTFSSALHMSPRFSTDDSQVAARLALIPGANMTILYDALVKGCTTFTSEMERRAIIVVSDGTDTASSASARVVMQHAAEANVAIYAVGLSSRYMERGKFIVRPPDPILREIAEDTGGGYLPADNGQDFSVHTRIHSRSR